MPAFHLVTRWSLRASPERIWEEMADVRTYPSWWPGFQSVTIMNPGDKQGLGAEAECVVKGFLPYAFRLSLKVTSLEYPKTLVVASTGALVGSGRLVLESAGPDTNVTYTWDVTAANAALDALSRFPPTRALLSRSHDGVMEQGRRNLAKRLAKSE